MSQKATGKTYLDVEDLQVYQKRSRGEAGETIHHLFMAKLKGYIQNKVYAKTEHRTPNTLIRRDRHGRKNICSKINGRL